MAAALVVFAPTVRAQTPPEPTPDTQTEKFSGTVVELSAEQVTVVRSTVGSKRERRTFLIKPETRVEGKLRLRARVTVGFVTTDDGAVANLIVVRSTTPKKP